MTRADQFMEEIWTLNPLLRGCPILSENIKDKFLQGDWDIMHLAKESILLAPSQSLERLVVSEELLDEMGSLMLHTADILRNDPSPDIQGLVHRIELLLGA